MPESEPTPIPTQSESSAAISLRASSMDMLFACPASVLNPDRLPIIKASGRPAAIGTAAHSLLASLVQTGHYDITGLVDRLELDSEAEEELLSLVWYGSQVWDAVGSAMPQAQVEARAEFPLSVGQQEYLVSGTIDVADVDSQPPVFIDYKSGYIETGHANQQFTYAYILWRLLGKPDDFLVKGIVAYLRHRYYRVREYRHADMAEWEYNLTRNILGNPDRYAPNPACVYCGLAVSCPARKAAARTAIEDVLCDPQRPGDPRWLEASQAALLDLTAETRNNPGVAELAGELLFRCCLLSGAADQVMALLKETAERVGGIPLPGDREYVVKVSDSHKLNPLRALPVLEARMSTDQLAPCMRISLPAVMKATGLDLNRKARKRAREDLLQRLTQAGALEIGQRTRATQQTIEPDPQPKPNTGESNGDGRTDSQLGGTDDPGGTRPGAIGDQRKVDRGPGSDHPDARAIHEDAAAPAKHGVDGGPDGV